MYAAFLKADAAVLGDADSDDADPAPAEPCRGDLPDAARRELLGHWVESDRWRGRLFSRRASTAYPLIEASLTDRDRSPIMIVHCGRSARPVHRFAPAS